MKGMTAKRFLVVVVSAIILFVLLLYAQKSAAKTDKLYIYNWTYYIPQSIIQKFEKEFNVRVFYDEYSSNEEMFAKIQSGAKGYDLIFPSSDYVSIMINEKYLEKIDRGKLSNLENIDPFVLEKIFYDPNMEYSVPYYMGSACVIVNTKKVPLFEKSWSIFSRGDLKNRIVMLDDMREVFGAALKSFGYSVNSIDENEIAKAADLIINNWKPNLTKFDSQAYGKGYASGDFWVVQGYAAPVYEEILNDQELLNNTEFFIPYEGCPSYLDSMCILRGAKNIENAYKFIDFIHRPQIYAEFCNTFMFPATVNIPARNFTGAHTLYTIDDLKNTEIKNDLGDKLPLYDDVWFNRIRVGK
ncbi:MAG: extracellular solute-binding protein [Termitinemataceae bacterium]|nr:MAG: extracellular solute-binding protein [Termitinemataceae bacterium]